VAVRESYRFALAQAASSFVGGVYVPFFPLWLAWQGLAPYETSLVVAAAMFMRILVSPAAGIIGDALEDRRVVAIACAGLSACGFALMGLAAPYWGIVAILPLMLFAVPLNSATGPIVEALTARGAIDYRFNYASVRVWGSIAFVFANYLGGWAVSFTGPDMIVWMVTACVVACAIAYMPLPPLLSDGRLGRRTPKKALARTLAEARVLLRQPVFLVFLAVVTCAQGSHAVFYVFGALTFRGFGYSDPFIGFLWALGTAAEVALFAVAPFMLRRAGAMSLIALGCGLGIIRWIGMAFDTGPLMMSGLQLLHAATFGLVHLGTMKFLTLALPSRLAATGQSLFAVAVYGAGMGAITLATGFIYDAAGPRAYLLMAALSVAALVLTFILARLWRGGSLFAFQPRQGVST
jgi:PPP family 3-phenylpropionic acid transporter